MNKTLHYYLMHLKYDKYWNPRDGPKEISYKIILLADPNQCKYHLNTAGSQPIEFEPQVRAKHSKY